MSNGQGPNHTFENLTQSGIMKLYSKENKDIALNLDVYGGSTSFVIFMGQGARPWKQTLPRKILNTIAHLLKKVRADIRPQRFAIDVKVYDTENRKMKTVGSIAFGIDETLTLFIELAHNDLQGRHTFPIKQDSKFDFSNTPMTEKDHLEALIDYVINVFTVETVVAERMTSFKRAPGGGRGNFGGGGGQRQGGGYSGGGQGSYQNRNNGGGQQGGTFGGEEGDNNLVL